MTPVGSAIGADNRMYAEPDLMSAGGYVGKHVTATGTGAEFAIEDANSLICKLTAHTLGDKEVQTLKVKATGGTFDLKVTANAATKTAEVEADATVAELQAIFDGLANLEVGDVVVSGTPGDFTLTFNLGANVTQVETVDDDLTGGEEKTEVATTTAGSAVGSLKVSLETYVEGEWQAAGEFAELTAAGSKSKVFGPLGTKGRWKWTLGAGDGAEFTLVTKARR